MIKNLQRMVVALATMVICLGASAIDEVPEGSVDLAALTGTNANWATTVNYPMSFAVQGAAFGDGDGSNQATHVNVADYEKLTLVVSKKSATAEGLALRVWMWDDENNQVVTLYAYPESEYETVADWKAEHRITGEGNYVVNLSGLKYLKGIKAANNWGAEPLEVALAYVTPKPEEPETPAQLVADGTYYIYNTEAQAYLSNGAFWGTRSVLADQGIAYGVSCNVENGKYTLKSGIKGDAKALRPSDGFNDQSGEWEIKETEGGFALFNGEKYFSHVEGSMVPGYTDDITAGSVWTFVTAESRKALLSDATAENPVDATVYIKAPDFLNSDVANAAWEGNKVGGNNASGNTLINNTNCEKWNAGSFTVSQTITDIPNGIYKLTVQAYYRHGGTGAKVDENGEVTTPSAADVFEAGEEVLPTLFANDNKVTIKSIFSEAKEAAEGGWAVASGAYFIPNSQAHAAECFETGAYINTIENIEVTDNTLTIGVTREGDAVEDWTVFDSFRLTYYGEKTETPEEPEGWTCPEGETDITTLDWVQLSQDCIKDFGEDKGNVFGTDAGGSNISYVDITNYESIKIYGAEGSVVRAFINREEADAAGQQFIFVFDAIGADGVATFDLSKVLEVQPEADHLYLSGIKAGPSWDSKATVYGITLTGKTSEEPEQPETPEEPTFEPLPFDPAGLTEIALSQSPDVQDGANRAAVEEGEGYTKYTSGNDISVIIKMMDIDVANCDYVLVKFAAPAPEGINISFWNGTDNVAVPAGATEYKYVFAEDEKCAISNDVLPQVALITLWNGGKEVYLTGVYKHVVEPEIAETIPAADPEPAAMEGYSWTENLVNNGDFTGDDISSFPVQGEGVTSQIIDGPNGAKVYEIQSADMVQFAWDSQVFIVSNEVLNEGDYYLVSFSYKAEVETTPSTQAHATPGNYLHWAMLNPNPTFSTEWKTTTWTGQISAAQAKGNDGNGNGTGMTTIAFNLNDLPTACKFYITNVVVKKQVANVVDGIASVDAAAKANGKYIENGKVVIVKNGVKYNVAGARIK